MPTLFKILKRSDWAEARRAGSYAGSAADRRDGFIHLSAADQVRHTAARHFAGQDGLLLVAFAEDSLANLKWEQSRGGALFPHVYGSISPAAALWVSALPLAGGSHRFPEGVPA